MLSPQTTFIGVDPSGGRKPFTYAAIDNDSKLIALAEGEMEEVLAFLGGQRSAYVAVNAPARPNKGVVKRDGARQVLPSLHHPGRGVDMRMAEHYLRERGIGVANTPAREEFCTNWMRLGFAFYKKLKGMGFQPYPTDDASHQWLETHPHAAFCVLLGQVPLPKPSLEGRLQRQLMLFEKGVSIKDPMDFFEEITRHKLLKGTLPADLIYSSEALDALAAAYTAYLAATQPDQVTLVGAAEEGQIVLPAPALKVKYE
jgi:hypothetical protein